MSDLLRMDYINSLPQPFLARQYDGWEWEVLDIDVGTGLMRINVCGVFQCMELVDFPVFIDQSGKEHDTDTFYSDYVEDIK